MVGQQEHSQLTLIVNELLAGVQQFRFWASKGTY